jgi:two-component system, NtrC family, sensor kinase
MILNRRILIIDDNRSIHQDFRKILAPTPRVRPDLTDLETEIFEETDVAASTDIFELTSAHQGQEGYALVKVAEEEGKPFAVAFVDVRMPPGWDGVETIGHLWEISPRLEVIICTAYSDYSREQITAKLGERVTVLRKPFDPVEVQRLACTLAERWAGAA